MSNEEIHLQIQELLENNKLDDLKRFINRRQCLNCCNIYLIYLFHFIQSAGILTTTIATGYNMKPLIWVGVGLSVAASFIHVIEQTNNNISKKIMKNIEAIKDNTYVDEGLMVDDNKDKKSNNNQE